MITAIVGEHNVSFQRIPDLIDDKFAAAELAGKYINIDHDSTETIKVSETSAFKKIVSGNPIQVRRLYSPYFTMRPRAKLIILTNSPPQIQTVSTYADMRRMDQVVFNKTISEEVADRDLIQKLTSPEELSGFVNLALVGLRYLLKQGWARSVSVNELREQWNNFGDTVGAFVNEKCFIDARATTPALELYSKYAEYCKGKHRTPEAANTFGMS